MMWTEQELVNLAAGSAETARERVIKMLGKPENEPLFGHFSLLWGIIGNAGCFGLDKIGAHKLWDCLLQNRVLDAYEKGILGDYNANISRQVSDLRMKPWRGLNNYLAGVKFENLILKPISDVDEELYNSVSTYYIDVEKLFHKLVCVGITPEVKQYLEKVRDCKDDDCIKADRLTVLRTLCSEIIYHKTQLKWDDKRYLFLYLREIIQNGTNWRTIGVDDLLLAALMADREFIDKSELESAIYIEHNQEVAELCLSFESEYGFFEEVAAKVVMRDSDRVQFLTDKCLTLMDNHTPRGVVFAMALVNLHKIRSAVTILKKLAEYGVVLEMNGYLHRLLPNAGGAEEIILNIIKRNLQILLTSKPFYQEYAIRRTFSAVRDFAENGNYDEACDLLEFIVLNGWLGDGDIFFKDYMNIANNLLLNNQDLCNKLEKSVKYMNLNIYEVEGRKYIGTMHDNPISMARERWQQIIYDATSFDLGKAGNLLKGVEAKTYGALNTLKNALNKKTTLENQGVDTQTEGTIQEAEEPKMTVTPTAEVVIQARVSENEVNIEPEPIAEPEVTEPVGESLENTPTDTTTSQIQTVTEDNATIPLDAPLDTPIQTFENTEIVADSRPLDEPVPLEDIIPLEEPKPLPEVQTFTMPDAPFDFDDVSEVNADGIVVLSGETKPQDTPISNPDIESQAFLESSDEPLDSALSETPTEVESMPQVQPVAEPVVEPVAEPQALTMSQIPTEPQAPTEAQIPAEPMPENNLDTLLSAEPYRLPSEEIARTEPELPKIEKWSDDNAETQPTKPLAHLKNIMKVNPDEIDRQYNKLKHLTSVVVEKASDKAQLLTEKVKEKSKGKKLSSLLSKLKSIRK